MSFARKMTVAFALTIAIAGSANASFVAKDWHAAGDGLITLDTNTGLDWLDITATTSLSYNYVNSQLGAGGFYEGWRYATDVEVENLFNNVGIQNTTSGTHDGLARANARSFIDNFYGNVTNPGDYFHYFQGLLHGTLDSSNTITRGLMEANLDSGQPSSWAYANWATFGLDSTHWSVGSMLIRVDDPVVANPVPEPESYALLLAGLGFLGFMVRRRKQQLAA